MVSRYRGTCLREGRLVPDVQRLLDALLDRDVALGVISNSTREEQIGKLLRLGILDRFEHIVVSGDHGINKPDRRLFDIALRMIGSPAERAVFVGDNWHADVEGARNAGLRAIWFNRFELPAPDPTVEQLRDFMLPEAIDRLLHR
jgi:putative hydrolase of the HAD superfamily